MLDWHLQANKSPAHKVDYLLNPTDKQDITLIFTLLNAIWTLHPPIPTDRTGFVAAHEALKTLSSLLHHLLLPYVQVTMSLHQQLVHLSTTAHLATFLYTSGRKRFLPKILYDEQLVHLSTTVHLATFLYTSGRKRFLPKILYDDIQIMIKNIDFCIAKTKVDHPNA